MELLVMMGCTVRYLISASAEYVTVDLPGTVQYSMISVMMGYVMMPQISVKPSLKQMALPAMMGYGVRC
jgi:hypothetical protein